MRRTIALLLACCVTACSPGARPDGATTDAADGQRDIAREADIARGGRLYDKWYAELGVSAPTLAHPAYPTDAELASRPDATWRCKECHGWDYQGNDGAYASGSHATGIGGVLASRARAESELVALLAFDVHGYADVLDTRDLANLAAFLSAGAYDMDADIDRETRAARGDAARGAVHYANLCAGCHGADGREDDMPELGTVCRKNPWEALHKIQNGQPGSTMPALRSLGPAVALDVLKHCQTLPGD